MKANELRIGNLVTDKFYDSFKKIITVESINEKGIELDIENSNDYPELQSHLIEPYYTFDELRGIPLTEEWLLRSECKKVINAWHIPIAGTYFVIRFNAGHAYCDVGGIYIGRIPFVHVLQNIVHALCGKELTLTPP